MIGLNFKFWLLSHNCELHKFNLSPRYSVFGQKYLNIPSKIEFCIDKCSTDLELLSHFSKKKGLGTECSWKLSANFNLLYFSIHISTVITNVKEERGEWRQKTCNEFKSNCFLLAHSRDLMWSLKVYSFYLPTDRNKTLQR